MVGRWDDDQLSSLDALYMMSRRVSDAGISGESMRHTSVKEKSFSNETEMQEIMALVEAFIILFAC